MNKRILKDYLVKELNFSKKDAQEETEKFTSSAPIDLQEEFMYYLCNRCFSEKLIEIDGYTAKKMLDSKLAINPYAAYNLMRQLIAEPDKILQGIRNGFRTK